MPIEVVCEAEDVDIIRAQNRVSVSAVGSTTAMAVTFPFPRGAQKLVEDDSERRHAQLQPSRLLVFSDYLRHVR